MAWKGRNVQIILSSSACLTWFFYQYLYKRSTSFLLLLEFDFSSARCSPVGSLFTNEEQEKVDLWCILMFLPHMSAWFMTSLLRTDRWTQKKGQHSQSCFRRLSRSTFNPFIAMLAALSLLKRPLKVTNLKSLMPSLPFTWAYKRISIKMHSIDCRFVVVPWNMLFASGICLYFSARKFYKLGQWRG